MKKILLITAIAAAFATTSVNADTTAVLKVTGQLIVGGCTPELSDGGVVDYGTIRLAALSATDVNQLGTKDVSLGISCPSATKAAWTITDDRADTHPGASVISIANGNMTNGIVSDTTMSYGVGKTTEGVKIGAFSIYTDTANVTADGVKSDAISGTVDSPVWQKSTTGIIKNGNMEMFTVATKGTTEPVPYTLAIFPLKTSLAIQDTATLAITDDTVLDGQATITLKYL
ncbi:DUF1120 domain-containing protein [Salmonella enterica subsp. enterica serovar Kentucky]|nr:DUF1120 domain-containing protein [Salmonella enterica subsp. enterica serovar Kentucky]